MPMSEEAPATRRSTPRIGTIVRGCGLKGWSGNFGVRQGMMAVAAHPGNRAITLQNENCPYCFRPFGSGLVPTKEHVIARNFVPKGTLQGCWNLILQACKQCNAAKAILEDDISAITMQPDAMVYASDYPRLIAEAKRKAQGSISRLTCSALSKATKAAEFKKARNTGTRTATTCRRRRHARRVAGNHAR